MSGKLIVNKAMKKRLEDAGLWDDTHFQVEPNTDKFWDDKESEDAKVTYTGNGVPRQVNRGGKKNKTVGRTRR
jgi:hypothetical protein